MSEPPIGRVGEDLARLHLERQGWRILNANYHSRFGEIDLIAEAEENGERAIIFIEVKTRRSRAHGAPIQAVGRTKQRRLWQTAQCWLSENGAPNDDPVLRFDILEIEFDVQRHARITHHRAVVFEGME